MNFSLLLRKLSLVCLSVWNVAVKMEMVHIFNWMGSTDTELRRRPQNCSSNVLLIDFTLLLLEIVFLL